MEASSARPCPACLLPRLTLAVAVCLAGPMAARAVVENGYLVVRCAPSPNGDTLAYESSSRSALDARCRYTNTTPTGVQVTSYAIGATRLAAGSKITPTANASVAVVMAPAGAETPNDSLYANAAGGVSYYLKINVRGGVQPPAFTPPLPVHVVATVSAKAGKSGDASARVVFSSAVIATTGDLLFGQSNAMTGEAHSDIAPGQQKLVSSGAACGAGAYIHPQNAQPVDDCNARADPTFEFDQELFDQRWGSQSFPIADYYEIEYSPNLATAYDLADDWSDAANPNGAWSLREGANLLPHVDGWEPESFTAPQPAWARSAGDDTRQPSWMQMVAPFPPEHDWQEGDVVVHTADDVGGVGAGPARVVWTSPTHGTINVHGGLWMGRELGSASHWEISLDGVPLTGGDLSSGDAYDRANPFDFATGSGGDTALRDVAVAPGAELALTLTRTTQSGDYVGVDLGVDVLPEPSASALLGASVLTLFAIRARRTPR